MYLNRAIIAGNLTRDPELRALPSGQKVASFSIATNRFWKDPSGNRQQSTDYHNIVVFGPQAETAAKYLEKGSQALVEGRMQTRSWEAPGGEKKYRTEVIADRVQFGQRPTSSASDSGGTEAANSTDGTDYPDDDLNPEDIPF